MVAKEGTSTTTSWDLPCHPKEQMAGNSTIAHSVPGVFHDVLDLAMSVETTHALAWWATHDNIHITCMTAVSESASEPAVSSLPDARHSHALSGQLLQPSTLSKDCCQQASTNFEGGPGEGSNLLNKRVEPCQQLCTWPD